MIADLNKKATFDQMMLLGGTEFAERERAGSEPTTPAEEFEGRNGYDPGFLSGWEIPLPRPTGARAQDVRPLRRGGDGSELKYQNFSVIISASRRLPMLTAVNTNGAESKSLPRVRTWSFDGRLNKEDQWGDALYLGLH
jgi:endonuclease G